jgi:hypothetical protein
VLLGAPEGKPAAAAVLWLDLSTGREANVRVYTLSGPRQIWDSGALSGPELLPGGSARAFAVATPLGQLELPGPRLRALRDYVWNGERVSETGRRKETPTTPGQRLEWAVDELDGGRAEVALQALGKLEAELAGSSELATEHALALDLMARCQTRLGHGPAMLETLRRLAREHPAEPAAEAAQAALAFIARNSVAVYVERENAAASPR